VKLNNLTIVPKLGILVGVTLFGLCVAGVLAGYLMQREMLSARIDQVHAIVDMGRNMAIGLQKQVDAGQLTKEAALAEFGRRASTLTYDNGGGYLFATNYDGITVLSPDPKQIGTNRMDIVINGRMISRELLDGVKAKGEILLTYEYVKPGEEKPIRKIGYAIAIPGWNMYLGSGAYLDDLDAKLKPVIWALGLAILVIALVSGGIAWMIGRSISRPLGQLGARMRGLADGALDGDIPGIERGDEVGAMAATVQIFKDNAVRIRGLEKIEAETQQRAGAERRAAMENIANDFERSVKGIVSSVATAAKGMQTTAQSMTATASDASARAATVGAASNSASNNVGTVAAAAEELSSSVTEISRQVTRSSEIASKAVGDAERTNATVQVLSTGAEKIGEVVKLIHSIAAQTNLLALNATNRSSARRRIRPRFRRRCLRGEGARQSDRQGYRGNLGAGCRHAVVYQRRGSFDQRNHRNDRADERDHRQHCHVGRPAGRGDPRDRAQHSVGRGRIERDQRPHRRRDHGGGGHRPCGFGCARQRPRTRQPVGHVA
jgi:methyl-accepting chemotaxis protein